MLLQVLHILVWFAHIEDVEMGCRPNTYPHCPGWGSCSRSCGGGKRGRVCKSCFWRVRKYFEEDCNQHCYNGGWYGSGGCNCPSWRSGSCCESCRHIYIAHCKSGKKSCGGSPDNIKCTECEDNYYSGGYGNGCNECSHINQCRRRRCTSYSNTRCIECYGNKILFKTTYGGSQCERMCASNNHYCWPGSCSNELIRGCSCAPNFKIIKHNGETSCQPKKLPSILTCGTDVVGPNLEMKQARSSTNSTECQYLTDMYGNFQPSYFKFDLAAEYTIDMSGYTKPPFISESHFGITDFATSVVKISIDGKRSPENLTNHLVDRSSSVSCKQTLLDSNNISITSSELQDGQALCLQFRVYAGGYLKSKDRVTHRISSAVPYQKVHITRELCYRFDNISPKHCQENGNCSYEPIQLESRLIRSTYLDVEFKGWYDPVPTGGNPIHASSIKSYQITVNEVTMSTYNIQVNYTSNVYTKKVNFSENRMSLYLTSEQPLLYCVTLEVKDVADNVRQARRFIVYDNSSFIEAWDDKPFYFTSASIQTNYKWQTHHHDICLNWKDHFLNRFYFNNPLLNHSLPEPQGLITGIYEQPDSFLPFYGTPNVHGIVQTLVSWTLNGGSPSAEIEVTNFLNQSFCKDFQVKDGQTYTIFIRAIDIVNNTFTENRTVFIDRSVPNINNIWLVKDGYKVLFVHHMTDLSKMQLQFEAFDPHSGVRQIEWAFGNTITELTSGSLIVGSFNETSCSQNAENCYCPDVGECEFYSYTVPLNKLIAINKHVGSHNRNYYFTLKVTNNAHLFNIERVDILVDDSPPEVGVIFEGPVDAKDIDYTSDNNFLVHWHGFIDHESGIKEYKIGLASRCLNHKDIFGFNNVSDIEFITSVHYTDMSVRIPANFTGKRYVSIIALNNAIALSQAVCSDGITRDLSPSSIRNLTLEHATWSETIVCHEGRTWLFHSSLTKIQIHNGSTCNDFCKTYPQRNSLASVLPKRHIQENDSDILQSMCGTLNWYQNNSIIYLPNNHIKLDWDTEEEESQIADIFAGIGTDPTELNSPSIRVYKSTLKQNSFTYIHEGIGSDELFYIFLKVVNKASLESVSILGPILIDETPPICREIPKVIIEEEYIVVGWQNDTFYDIEQDDEINSIYFDIGYANTKVTPLLKWELETSPLCSGYNGGCFKYPIKKLQKQDHDLGLSFYVNMHVYNKAGHFIIVSTDTFEISSTYPPGLGIVLDVDPEDESHLLDTNAHFTTHTLCLRWYGFKHHESVRIEVGVGSNNMTDNVVPYSTLNHSTSYYCIKNPNIEFQKTYYGIVKASCTGGLTVSSSNGIVVLNELKLLDSLNVNLGEECSTFNRIYSARVNLALVNNSVTFPAYVGKRYWLFVNDSSIESVITNDGIIENNTGSNNKFYLTSFVEYPVVSFISTNGTTNQETEIYIHKCPDAKYLIEREGITAHWFYDEQVPYGLTFQIAILRIKNITENLFAEPFKQYESAVNRQTFKFQNIGLELNKFYKLAVKQCTNVRCLAPIFSDSFSVSRPPETGKIYVARLLTEANTSFATIDLEWNAFHSGNSIRFYQWAVSNDNTGNGILTKWQTIKDTKLQLYQVHTSIDLPVHPYSTKFGCIRAFDQAENEAYLCQQIKDITNEAYMASAVYDFDSNAIAWKTIIKMLHSSNIGSLYTLLHENELDFGTQESEDVGAIMYASERNITWFLMEDPLSCDFNKVCVVSKVTNNGFVSFDKTLIKFNTIYYICAYSISTSVIREMHTEVLDQINTCSNGFVLDSIAPVAGKVEIRNNNGFLASLDNIELSWNKFEDNIDATQFGYPRNIASYSYEIGSRPHIDDIRRFTNVGYKTRSVINNLNLPDGSSVFVTVKAKDHAGNSASVSSNKVIVDTSPPLNGKLQISTRKQFQDNYLYLTETMLKVHLSGFKDIESGLDHFEIGIGTQPFFTDILSSNILHEDNFDINMQDYDIKDGHPFYIAAKAFNRAGLSSEFTYLRTKIDTSPPNGGHVFEGLMENQKEEDYQSDIMEINVHWDGFSDPHSGIAFYRAALGTEPFSENIEPFMNVGLLEYTTWHGDFSSGETYFTTIEACNGAGLCIARSSDGITLDTSPPTPGSVHIGSAELHKKYQSHTSSVHVTWAEFKDPESSIDHYEICIGTSAGKCDISERIDCLLRSSIFITGLRLPFQTPLFATVTAFNKLFLNVTQSSDSFFVDGTSPLVLIRPFFIVEKNNNHAKIGHWDRSVVHIQWEFVDNESPIVRHYVSLVTHHEGHNPVENIQLGAENNLTIIMDDRSWLHNGDTYFVTVTSCNLAGLCVSERTNDLIIDSTPPHLGGFKPPMFWKNLNRSITAWKSNITLSWYGFHDHESGIERYFITISKRYSGNEITNGVATVYVNASDSQTEHSFTFLATDNLERGDKLYLTIWAENFVGLSSSLARASVFVLSISSTADVSNQMGTLELDKHSCDVQYCNEAYTCSIVGRPCADVQSNSTCQELGSPLKDKDVPKVQVFNGLDEKSPNITISSACLSGSWKVIDSKTNTRSILRFEWSMGLHSQQFGEGIFDLKNENPWHDVGLQSKIVHCLPVNRSLIAREKYVIYVRAWLSRDNYATFHSTPILVDHSPPSLLRGNGKIIADRAINTGSYIVTP